MLNLAAHRYHQNSVAVTEINDVSRDTKTRDKCGGAAFNQDLDVAD